jgi:acetate kinase
MLVADRLIGGPEEIEAAAHRVVHGGESFQESTLITDSVIAKIRALRPLAPLHNPAELDGIVAARELLPGIPHVAHFDTAFSATLPDHAYVYGLPYELYKTWGIRRYGFHGLSHSHLMHRCAALMERPAEELKIVSCHLGSGGSITAIDRGKVSDTSMGYTPTEGLVMESRCGDIDPSLVPLVKSKERLTTGELQNLLNKFSGLLGLSGLSGEMNSLLKYAAEGNERACMAIDVFCYRIRKYIASYAGVLGGLDALVFSSGIGFNAPSIRAQCTKGLEFLGVELDAKKNEAAVGIEAQIARDSSRVKVFTIADDEEMTMAILTRDVVEHPEKAKG